MMVIAIIILVPALSPRGCFQFKRTILTPARARPVVAEAVADGNLTIGDLLAEVVARQQQKMPAEDQLRLAEANLDAMVDGASAELADYFDDYSEELYATEQNISTALRGTLDVESAASAERINNATLKMRRGLIEPNRRRIQRELSLLREREEELKQQREAETSYGARSRLVGRDAWWEARLDKGGSSVRNLELSASFLGLLLFLGAIDLAFPLGGPIHANLVTAWRLGFCCGLALYLASLASVTQTEMREPYEGRRVGKEPPSDGD